MHVNGKLGTHASAIYFVRSEDGVDIDEPPSEDDRVLVRSDYDLRVRLWTPVLVSMVKVIAGSQFFYFDFL